MRATRVIGFLGPGAGGSGSCGAPRDQVGVFVICDVDRLQELIQSLPPHSTYEAYDKAWELRASMMQRGEPMTCANCKLPLSDHCKVHVIPCCPGNCTGSAAPPSSYPEESRTGVISETAEPSSAQVVRRVKITETVEKWFDLDDEEFRSYYGDNVPESLTRDIEDSLWHDNGEPPSWLVERLNERDYGFDVDVYGMCPDHNRLMDTTKYGSAEPGCGTCWMEGHLTARTASTTAADAASKKGENA